LEPWSVSGAHAAVAALPASQGHVTGAAAPTTLTHQAPPPDRPRVALGKKLADWMAPLLITGRQVRDPASIQALRARLMAGYSEWRQYVIAVGGPAAWTVAEDRIFAEADRALATWQVVATTPSAV
jgi:hypothetical protein